MLKAGDTLGAFEIIELIGKGGMGEVYSARDPKLGRIVAIKVLPDTFAKDADRLSRFEREARLLASLNHPNIATIHDFYNDDNKHFLVMERIGGESLGEYIGRGRETDAKIVGLFIQMADALAAAHDAGIVHRDLKPDNIKIDNGRLKVLDFGLAKDSIQQPPVNNPNSPTVQMSPSPAIVTEYGMIMGTPMYMSPEQARGAVLDQRTDVWAFGCCLFEALSGHSPFEGNTSADVLSAVLERSPDYSQISIGTSKKLIGLVRSCLEKDPSKRPRNMHDIVAEFQEMLDAGGHKKGMSIATWGALAGIAISLLAVVAFLGTRDNDTPTVDPAPQAETENLLPQVFMALDTDDYVEAFTVAERLQAQEPDNEILATLWDRMSNDFDFISDPPGAKVYVKDYHDESDVWEEVGVTPLKKKMPYKTFRAKFVLDGYRDREVARVSESMFSGGRAPHEIKIALRGNGDSFPKMLNLTVEKFLIPLPGFPLGASIFLPEYLIDRTEVTNSEYKEFVDAGGYADPKWWQHAFELDGETLSFDQAVTHFTDSVGKTGPAGWDLGDYPEGEDDYPVGGVSWFEAAAYAAFRGKALPSVYHWAAAAYMDAEIARPIAPDFQKNANMDSGVIQSADGTKAIATSGALKMAGNQREWAFNEGNGGRYILGGSWEDQRYMLLFQPPRTPWDRSLANGFRCAVYSDDEPPAEELFAPNYVVIEDLTSVAPIPDVIFDTLVNAGKYTSLPMEAVTEQSDISHRDYDSETVIVNGVDGNRMKFEVIMPKVKQESYSAIIFFPGSDALIPSEFDATHYVDMLNFVPKSGRVLVIPHYRELWEHADATTSQRLLNPTSGPAFIRMWAQDIRRTFEYLDSRSDIQNGDTAFFGISLGAIMGSYLVPYNQDRLATAMLVSGGLSNKTAAQFIQRIAIPTIMINGKTDYIFPVDPAQTLMYKYIGTPPEHKRHVIIEGGHMPDKAALARESLLWLDRYQSQVTKEEAEL